MGKYDDIINLPPKISLSHPHMSMNDRAAQFLPFAALTGYDASILEAARLTAEKRIISKEDKEEISKRLFIIKEHIAEFPIVNVTYFIKDIKKDGGKYVSISETIKKIDDFAQVIITSNGVKIPFNDIYKLESSIIDEYQYLF